MSFNQTNKRYLADVVLVTGVGALNKLKSLYPTVPVATCVPNSVVSSVIVLTSYKAQLKFVKAVSPSVNAVGTTLAVMFTVSSPSFTTSKV